MLSKDQRDRESEEKEAGAEARHTSQKHGC